MAVYPPANSRLQSQRYFFTVAVSFHCCEVAPPPYYIAKVTHQGTVVVHSGMPKLCKQQFFFHVSLVISCMIRMVLNFFEEVQR